MSLEESKEKRNLSDPSETSEKEPAGNESKVYVIQKHDASSLHHDLRLERDGVLKSWAIPKKPPTEKSIKRLAIQTEDHTLKYASFEGKIPEGRYGAGEVEIWDKGTYDLEEWKENEKIIIHIKGTKLKGRYCLIKLSEGEKNWLFFKI